jgi:hypothetical protein
MKHNDFEGDVRGVIEVFHVIFGTEENHGNPESRTKRFEPR